MQRQCPPNCRTSHCIWWGVLGDGNVPNTPLPISASILMVIAIAVCLLAFGLNIFWSMSRTPLVTSNAR